MLSNQREATFPTQLSLLFYFKAFSAVSWLCKVWTPHLAAAALLYFFFFFPGHFAGALLCRNLRVWEQTEPLPLWQSQNNCKMPPAACRHRLSINIHQPRPQKGEYSRKEPTPWAIEQGCQGQPSKTRWGGLERHRVGIALDGSMGWAKREETGKWEEKLKKKQNKSNWESWRGQGVWQNMKLWIIVFCCV